MRYGDLVGDVAARINCTVTMVFKICTYNLPSLISKKYAYDDDLMLLHTLNNWKSLKGALNQDITTLAKYLQTRRLKLSHSKTVMTAFHLNNWEAKHKLAVYNNTME